jgi:predicted RNA-binding protein with PUA-like domain
MNWLIKEEPSSYSFEQLVRDRGTRWSGVKNPLARRHLGTIRKGDRILYYHTGSVKAVVGTARAAGHAVPDPADPAGKGVVVDIVAVAKLPRPVTLAEIRLLKTFAGHPLLRMPRLSVMPVDDRQWAAVEKAAGQAPAR